MKNLLKKFTAITTVLSLFATLCLNASAETTVVASISADQKTETLSYVQDELIAKDFNGNDYDYGSFEEKKDSLDITNPTQKLGLKALWGWKVNSGATGINIQTDVDSHSGRYAMKFTNIDTQAASNLLLYPAIGEKATDESTTDIKGLVPYANYQFTFWYKGSNKTLDVHYYTNIANNPTEIVSEYACSDTWQQASINIMADSVGTIKLWLDFGEEVSSGQYVLLDDVKLYRCGVGADGEINLFGDDGLESTVTGDFTFKTTKSNWMEIKDAKGNYTHFARMGDVSDEGTKFSMGVSEDTAYSGNKSLKIVSTETAVDYELKLRPQYVYYNYSSATSGCVLADNGYYTLSFWVKGDPTLYGIYAEYGDTPTYTSYTFSNFKSSSQNISASQWKQAVIRNIPVTTGNILADIKIYIYGTNHGATEMTPLYIDDIQLVKQSEYIINGSLEQNEIGATEINDFNVGFGSYEIADDAIDGNKSLKVTQDAEGTDGSIYPAENGEFSNLPAGTYISSVWIKSPTNVEKANKIVFKNTYGSVTDKTDIKAYGWDLATVICEVEDGGSVITCLSALGGGNYANMEYLIDDWRLEKAEDALSRIRAKMSAYDGDKATAQETLYLMQWVNNLVQKGYMEKESEEVKALRRKAGDMTYNGVLDATDLTYMRRYLIKVKEAEASDFDVNGDGSADLRDLIRLKKRLVNFAV